MTIQEQLTYWCEQHGLWPDEARAVVTAQFEASDDDVKHRRNDEVQAYPPQLMVVLWMDTKRHALAYIDANKPKHWARPMFTGELEEA